MTSAHEVTGIAWDIEMGTQECGSYLLAFPTPNENLDTGLDREPSLKVKMKITFCLKWSHNPLDCVRYWA